jgi:integrase
LTLADVCLDAVPPHIKLHARHDKARRGARQPLPDDLARAIREFLDVRLKEAQEDALQQGVPAPAVLDQTTPLISEPPVRTFDRDLKAAGIAKKDDSGRSMDLHALRHTFGTLLARSGVAPRTAMDLMRHADIRLTTAIYQHLDLLDTAGAVNRLPTIDLAEKPNKTAARA